MLPLPVPVAVAVATSVPTPPVSTSGGWEVKLDGWRAVLLRGGDEVVLHTRAGRVITDQFPELAAAAGALPEQTVLDGEIVVPDASGAADFGAVQSRGLASARKAPRLAGTHPAVFAAFDVLVLDGADVRPRRYTERRALLAELTAPGQPLQPVPATGDRTRALEWARAGRALGIEGLVAKPDAPYRAGTASGWRKWRWADTLDATIVGFLGPPERPEALVVVPAGQREPVVSSPLPAAARARFGRTLAALPSPPTASARTPDGAGYRPVAPELTVEVLAGHGRHATVRVVRLR
ncbi:ATP-dependent DNA ligase [Streptomyces sp. TRM70308]|uniref:ATP-dependent DNA ligase n=1 Tax=Streptomyces sp. TRM70308 TaxID=3131932 RepID=UPI003CFC2FB8